MESLRQKSSPFDFQYNFGHIPKTKSGPIVCAFSLSLRGVRAEGERLSMEAFSISHTVYSNLSNCSRIHLDDLSPSPLTIPKIPVIPQLLAAINY